MTPSRIANNLRGEYFYHTPIRVGLSTKKLSNCEHSGAIRVLGDKAKKIMTVPVQYFIVQYNKIMFLFTVGEIFEN
jgi:hypothetical protein